MSHRPARYLIPALFGIVFLSAAAAASPATRATGLSMESLSLTDGIPQQTAAKVFRLKVTAETANIRVKPSIGSNIIKQFPLGTILEAELKEGEWYLIKFEADPLGVSSGYVHESLVLPLDGVPAVTAPPAAPRPADKAPEKKPAETVPTPKTEIVTEAKAKPPVYDVTNEILADSGASSLVSLAVWGGAGLTAVGDLNTGAVGLADFLSAQIEQTADVEVSPAHAGLLFGGEAMFTIAPQFKIAVGAEYLWASRESVLTFAEEELIPSSLTLKPGFSAIPVHLGFVYYPLDFLYLKAGVEYTFAKAKYGYTFVFGNALRDWQGEASAGGAGIFGGVGVDLSLGRGLGLTAEIGGRYARISGFSGTDTYLDEDLIEPYIEEGILYAYDARTSSQTVYSLVFIRGSKPAENGVENARKAKLDLSGISLKIGLKYKF